MSNLHFAVFRSLLRCVGGVVFSRYSRVEMDELSLFEV